jgi:hypothetical protein
MASFNSRRGPNVSQYLRELHTIPEQDSAAGESFNMDDDLAMFTNTQFFDFDSGQNTDYNAPPVKPETTEVARQQSVSRSEDVVGGLVDPVNFDFRSIQGSFNHITSTVLSLPPSCSHFSLSWLSFLRFTVDTRRVPSPLPFMQYFSQRASRFLIACIQDQPPRPHVANMHLHWRSKATGCGQ